MKAKVLSTKSDQELVTMMVADSALAFGELYARYKSILMYFLKRFLKGEANSEDIIQEIFIKIWNTRKDLNPELSFSGYLHTMAQNQVLNVLRRIDIHSRFVKKTLELADETVNQTECLIMDNDYARLLNEAIETLSPRQKDVFQLSRVQGLSYREIAELLQISPNMVQEHASIALHKIKKYLTQHADIHFAIILLYLL